MMEFELSDKAKAVEEQILRFMDEYVYPAEKVYAEQAHDDPHADPPIMLEMRAKAKGLGLWNLFLPDEEWGAGLTNLEYTPLCEIMGRSGTCTSRLQLPGAGHGQRRDPGRVRHRRSRRIDGSFPCSRGRSAPASR